MAQTAFFKQPFHYSRRFLAKIWLKFFPKLTIIGITGSYGKTNTTRAIATVLSQKYQTEQTDLNLDTIYNLPLTILRLRPGCQKLVLEYGVDHKQEMDYHLALVKPQIGVITGINPTHSDPQLLGSVEGIIQEKSKLLTVLPQNGWALLNWDDPRIRLLINKTQAQVIRYGLSLSSDYRALEIKVDFSGTSFILCYRQEKIPIKTGLIGAHFVHACLAAAAIGQTQGLSWQEITRGLAQLKPLKGRLSIEKGPHNSILLNDALRANPASTLAGLQTLVDLPLRSRNFGTQGKRIAVLGEMGELGDDAEKEHRQLGQKIAKMKIDYLISIGPLQKLTSTEAIKSGMPENQVFWAQNIEQAAKQLKKILQPGDLLYLKGSLLRHLERVLLYFNNPKIGCLVNSCHHYHSCSECRYLLAGSVSV